MFVEVKKTVVFHGTPTTSEERRILRDAGFIHVTGLTATMPHSEKVQYVIGEKLAQDDLGKWEQNNSRVVVVTEGGEVWLTSVVQSETMLDTSVKRRFAPNGRGGFVPLSNGEVVEPSFIFNRAADPSYGLVYQTM